MKAEREAKAKSKILKWLEKLEAEGVTDPVPQYVSIAVDLCHGTEDDRLIWMKIANRNINSFMGIVQDFAIDLEKPSMSRLRHPPSAFQKRLNRVLPKPEKKGMGNREWGLGIGTQMTSSYAEFGENLCGYDASACDHRWASTKGSIVAEATPRKVFAKVRPFGRYRTNATLAFFVRGVGHAPKRWSLRSHRKANSATVVATTKNAKSAYRASDLRSKDHRPKSEGVGKIFSHRLQPMKSGVRGTSSK